MIQTVGAGSGAAGAGLKAGTEQVVIAGESFRMGGDVIVAADGKPVSSIDELRDVIAAHKPGEKIELKIYRGDKAKTVTVTLGRQPTTPRSSRPRAGPSLPAGNRRDRPRRITGRGSRRGTGSTSDRARATVVIVPR